MGVTLQLQLAVAGLLCQPQGLFRQGGAFLQPVRPPYRHPPGIDRGAQRRRISQPTGHGDRLQAEGLHDLRLVREGEFRG
jgi:hypothetical protein